MYRSTYKCVILCEKGAGQADMGRNVLISEKFPPVIQSPIAELSFVTLTIHLCSGLNDKNLVKPRKTCFY